MPIYGDLQTLANSEMATWRGWVIYSWEHGFRAYLYDYDKKPTMDEIGYSFEHAIEGVGPYFLRACGISIKFDHKGRVGHAFYYGKHSDQHGNHEPIEIELTLPRELLCQLNLIN